MKTIDLEDGHQVTLYTSCKELPMRRYSQHQKYLLFDAGVGSDMEAVTRHFEKLYTFLGHGKTTEAIAEGKNLHFNLFYQLQEVSFKGLAFACLTHSIDGHPVTDFSEDSLKTIGEKLSNFGLTQAQLESELEEVKKKLDRELKAYFPAFFTDEVLLNMTALIQKKNSLMLEYIHTDNGALLPRIEELEKELAGFYVPQNYDLNSADNVVYQHESGFENLCAQLEDFGAQDVAGLTVFSFYHKVNFYNKKHSINGQSN